MKKKSVNAYARLHTNVAKEELDAALGEVVTITLMDGSVINGMLGFTKEFSAEYGYRQPGYYTIRNFDFRCVDVKKIDRSAFV